MRFWPVVFLLACSEYDLNTQTGPNAPPHGNGPSPFGDSDCVETVPEPYSVPTNNNCRGIARVMNFEPIEEWSWESNPIHPGYHMVMMTPAVGDINGDGDVDIVFVAYKSSDYTSSGVVVGVSGRDGSTLFSYKNLNGATVTGTSGVAIADTDGDGSMSIFVSTSRGLASLEADGTVNWIAYIPVHYYAAPAVADMDGDGESEIVLGASVVNADGTVRWTGWDGTGNGIAFPVDLTGDGQMEVVAGDTVYSSKGAVLWTMNMSESMPAVADMDGDGEPEVIAASIDGVLSIWESDGTLLRQKKLGTTYRGGPPTVADYDGDGLPEIGIAGGHGYTVFKHDLSILWQQTTVDSSSGHTGSSVFDFEGDGAAEVVYADEHTLFIFDGATGAVEMSWTNHASGTLVEYPPIADVDGDGSAELVVASNDMWWPGKAGITIVGDAKNGWVSARKIWNQHAYSITNINDDGTVPQVVEPNWLTYNTFRAGNSETPHSLDRPDLRVSEPAYCHNACEKGYVEFYIPVENAGLVETELVEIALYDREGGLIGVETVPVVGLDESFWLGPVNYPIDAIPEDGFILSVDDDGSGAGNHAECDEDNNTYEVDDIPCF